MVRRLRAKVDDPFKIKLIHTIRGAGKFSKPVEPRSIASQLVLFFTLAASFLLCCGLGVSYGIFVQHAFEEDTAGLADKVLALRADLTTARDPKALNEELKSQQAGRERVAYWVRPVNSEGVSVAETPAE